MEAQGVLPLPASHFTLPASQSTTHELRLRLRTTFFTSHCQYHSPSAVINVPNSYVARVAVYSSTAATILHHPEAARIAIIITAVFSTAATPTTHAPIACLHKVPYITGPSQKDRGGTKDKTKNKEGK